MSSKSEKAKIKKEKKQNRKRIKHERRIAYLKSVYDTLRQIEGHRKIIIFRNESIDPNLAIIHIFVEGIDKPIYSSPPLDMCDEKNIEIFSDIISNFTDIFPITTNHFFDYPVDRKNKYTEIINDFGDSLIFCTFYADDDIHEMIEETEDCDYDDIDFRPEDYYRESFKSLVEIIMKTKRNKKSLCKIKEDIQTKQLTFIPIDNRKK